MLSLVIVHHEAGVDNPGDPAEKCEQQAQNETRDSASHEDGDRRKDDAKKVTERFHRNGPQARTFT